jgi:hypothetical protein
MRATKTPAPLSVVSIVTVGWPASTGSVTSPPVAVPCGALASLATTETREALNCANVPVWHVPDPCRHADRSSSPVVFAGTS